MRAFFDTSVLIPAVLGEHPHHRSSLVLFDSLRARNGYCSAHSLAEVYSALTRMPVHSRLSPERTLIFLDDIRSRLTPVALEPDEYFEALRDFAAMGIVGGATYDGLHVRCALKAKADTIYTWNVSHFSRFGPDIEKRLRTP